MEHTRCGEGKSVGGERRAHTRPATCPPRKVRGSSCACDARMQQDRWSSQRARCATSCRGGGPPRAISGQCGRSLHVPQEVGEAAANAGDYSAALLRPGSSTATLGRCLLLRRLGYPRTAPKHMDFHYSYY
jgi:hypothetical protein